MQIKALQLREVRLEARQELALETSISRICSPGKKVRGFELAKLLVLEVHSSKLNPDDDYSLFLQVLSYWCNALSLVEKILTLKCDFKMK
jgi:hypothetical protein